MADNMEIRVNPLPSRTWNWLKMNDSPLAARPLTAGGKLAVSGLTPGLAWTDGVTPDDRWAEVETGMGRELDRLLDKAPAALLTAEPGAHPAEPVVIRWTCPDGGQAADRVLIEAGADSELSVILVLGGGRDGLGAVQTKVRAAAGGKVRVYVIQMMDGTAVSLCDYGAVCGENARAELVRLELGGAQGYTGVYTRLDGDNSEFAADAGYHVRGGQRLDMNYTVRHVGKKTRSEMRASGVLEEDASKIFRGTIDFPRGCRGAKGSETEEVLLLGNKQVNQTIPLILCQEEDVEGDHGATIGRLDEQVLFYMASRGISRAAAERIIAQARLDAVSALIPSDAVRAEIADFLKPEGEGDSHEEL